MAILDKLIEKKDINAYIAFRIVNLKIEMDKAISDAAPSMKEYVRERFNGRILELKELKKTIAEGTEALKNKSKRYSRRTTKPTRYLRLPYTNRV